MPKAKFKKRNGGASHDASSPYAAAAKPPASGVSSHNIFRMKTDMGQHVLKNPGVARAIVDKADLKQSDVVLEVGPGTGNLTQHILQRAKRVLAVELDPRMAAELTKRFQPTSTSPQQQQNHPHQRLEILLGDVIRTPLSSPIDVCISNTPYQISSPLVFKLLSLPSPPRTAILMFQREFAQRLSARPGDPHYSRLSANVQMWARVEHVMKVGRGNFRPPPQVESAVVRMVPRRPRPQVAFEEWDGLLRLCFGRKNRTLRAGLLGSRAGLEVLVENYRVWCAENDVPVLGGSEDARGEDEGGMEIDNEDEDADEEEDEEWNGFMDIDEELSHFLKEQQKHDEKPDNPHRSGGINPKRKKKKGKLHEAVREKIREVLEDETGLADKRARMCDEGDFLRLLYAFNRRGIHFA